MKIKIYIESKFEVNSFTKGLFSFWVLHTLIYIDFIAIGFVCVNEIHLSKVETMESFTSRYANESVPVEMATTRLVT